MRPGGCGATIVVDELVAPSPILAGGPVSVGGAFGEYQCAVGGIDNSDEFCAAFPAIKSITFKPRRIDIGGEAATEI